MNFLSHYYFERYSSSSEQVLGGLLPDLLKNVNKNYSFQIHKISNRFPLGKPYKDLTAGWERHVEVDRLFHSSDYFYCHTHEIRKRIEEIVDDLPIRASFLAHISLELLLDHLLIVNNNLNVGRLYEHLEVVDKKILFNYLSVLEIVEIDSFINFYNKFVASKYIFDYERIENISHVLFNICKRVWDFEPEPIHFERLTFQLEEYKKDYLNDYGDIYAYIAQQLD